MRRSDGNLLQRACALTHICMQMPRCAQTDLNPRTLTRAYRTGSPHPWQKPVLRAPTNRTRDRELPEWSSVSK